MIAGKYCRCSRCGHIGYAHNSGGRVGFCQQCGRNDGLVEVPLDYKEKPKFDLFKIFKR